MKQRLRLHYRWTALLILALVAAACGGNGGGDGDGEAGGEVNVLTAFTEPQDVAGFEAMAAAFTEETGINVVHEGSPAFEETAVTRIEGGNPPDIIMHPQPGLLEDFVDRGAAQPLDFFDMAALEDELVSGLVDLGTFNDEFYGLQVRLSLKSLVWYPTAAFEEGGYQVPETWDDMLALSEEIAATGTTPWCIGVESDQATGWPATDWIEDIMLRLHGAEVYDQWVTHELPFNSPEVTAAFERMGEIWFTEDWVLGGRQNILQTSFSAAPLPMFEEPPACLLHRQASFIQQSFPEDSEYGTDYDFFFFPPIVDGGTGESPALIAGDLAALYTDNEAAKQFIEFMATAGGQENWAAEGAFLCSNRNCDPSVYPNDALRSQAEIVANADVARFDGSDLMPGPVGAGAFWTETVNWIADQQDLETTLTNIDNAWPAD